MRRRSFLQSVLLLPAILLLAACGTLLRQPAPTDRPPPTFDGFGNIRYYPLASGFGLPDLTDAYRVEAPDQYQIEADGTVVYSYLALSGGGSAGAFGAGLLNGWTAKGDRPKFKVVTGVSTGALISTLAFLGPDYDDELKEAYTTIDATHIYIAQNLLSLIWSESVTDNKPFRDMIAKYLTNGVLDKVAAEYKKGRRLYVLTSDLDRELPVIWDLGAIASSSSPRRLDLYRQVVLASASIPAVFPPVLINVTVDGKPYDELHVDGGVFAQSFFIGNSLDLKKTVHDAHPGWKKDAIQRLYVIRNGRIDAQTRVTNRTLGSISGNSISTMLKISGINDLYRLYVGELTGELEFYYVAFPIGYMPVSAEEFNKEEMNKEYDLGYKYGTEGIPWQRMPPGYRP
ncbi:MAG TPA: patatin-like phospholipase family protein [Dongiaceae bacterium]|jgi:predicted patatin/cPLA2 family phospholipase